MDIAHWVKAARTKAGLSQDALGQHLGGLTKANVSSWETGRHKPKLDQVLAIHALSGLALPPPLGGPNVAPSALGSRQIPLISSVQAGLWTEIGQTFEPADSDTWLLTDLDLSGRAFALEIKGESMLPDFKPGGRVIIDPAIAPSPGDFVVARNGSNEATFKKYRPRGLNERGQQVIELVPLNPDFPALRSDTSPITIIGTMVEHRRYRRK